MASWYDLKGTLQKAFRIGSKNLVIDANAPTIERTFYIPDSNVDFRSGAIEQVITQTGANSIGMSDPQALRLLTRAFNATGSTIAKATVIYLSGVQGDRPKVVKSQANTEATSSKTFGLVFVAAANMSDVTIINEGLITGLDTDIVGWTEGDSLWLSPTVAGEYTNVKPSSPDHAVFIGTLVRKHQNQGSIQVRIQNGYELQELHNVSIPTTPTNGQVLTYETSTSLWKAQTPSGGSSAKSVRGFGVDGFATVGTLKALPILIPTSASISNIKAYCRTAPVGADLIFDIKKNGTTIFTTLPDRLKIVAGTNSGVVGAYSTALTANDVLELNIDQIGSTTAGKDITIVIEVQ